MVLTAFTQRNTASAEESVLLQLEDSASEESAGVLKVLGELSCLSGSDDESAAASAAVAAARRQARRQHVSHHMFEIAILLQCLCTFSVTTALAAAKLVGVLELGRWMAVPAAL